MNAITRIERAQFEAPTVTFTLNGRPVTGLATDTILEIADREGIEIPRLC
jgi:formate dehydrogenase major subunit